MSNSKDSERTFVLILADLIRINLERNENETLCLALELSGMTKQQWNEISPRHQQRLIKQATDKAKL